MFSGGSYEEVARWLHMFLTSHAKREDPRVEVQVDAKGAREGVSYGARLVFEDRTSEVMEFEYRDVAAHRGSLDWCAALARRVRDRARSLLAATDASHR